MEDNQKKKKPEAPDYKPYPKREDVYNQEIVVPLKDEIEQRLSNEVENGEAPPEDFPPKLRNQIKTPADDDWNTENFDTDHSGYDLDVPGSELDDADEETGDEDEENNYYSLGGPRKGD